MWGRGVDVDVRGSGGRTASHFACEYGHLEVLTTITDICGNTTLHKACYWAVRSLETTKWLIENGSDVNKMNSSGDTPLHFASSPFFSKVTNVETLKLLVANGAYIQARNKDGETPLHVACSNGTSLKVIQCIIDELGAKVNFKDDYGQTPLHLAALKGHWDVVKLLATRRANVDAKTSNGATPLHLACKHNRANVVWTLLRQNPFLVLE